VGRKKRAPLERWKKKFGPHKKPDGKEKKTDPLKRRKWTEVFAAGETRPGGYAGRLDKTCGERRRCQEGLGQVFKTSKWGGKEEVCFEKKACPPRGEDFSFGKVWDPNCLGGQTGEIKRGKNNGPSFVGKKSERSRLAGR